MKMESAKVCGLLAASLLIFILLIDPTVACTCPSQSLTQRFCQSEFILKAKVLDAITHRQKSERLYKIKPTRVLKGPKMMKRFQILYTSSESKLCGYQHPRPFNEDEYVFGVRQRDGHLFITLCEIHKKWNSLPLRDKKGFERRFQKHCPRKPLKLQPLDILT